MWLVILTTSDKPNLRFEYDAIGNRTAKHVEKKNGDIISTYYVRDAQTDHLPSSLRKTSEYSESLILVACSIQVTPKSSDEYVPKNDIFPKTDVFCKKFIG